MSHPAPAADEPREPRWRPIACFVLMLAAVQAVAGPKIRLSQWELSAEANAGVAEAGAWIDGRLDLPQPPGRDPLRDRPHDTALFDGRVYNVFPPLIGLLTVLLSPLHEWLSGDAARWLPWTYVPLLFWPLPIAAFVALRRQTGDSAWAALLTFAYLSGTGVLPCLNLARGGQLGAINHLLSQIGLLILAADLLGRRRIWPAMIGLAIAGWSRQMTLLYALPLLWIVWSGRRAASRRRALGLSLCGLIVIVAPLLTLNALKFGNPLNFGYRHIYAGRDDPMAQRCAAQGTFSPRFVPENLWYMHVQWPEIDVGLTGYTIIAGGMGTSIWVTTPLLLFVLPCFAQAGRRIIARGNLSPETTGTARESPSDTVSNGAVDPLAFPREARGNLAQPGARVEPLDRVARTALLLSTVLVMTGLLCYHTPGFLQPGYHRFALDFIPIWLVLIARHTRGGRRTWLTLACIAWSVLYFQAVTPDLPRGG